MEIILLLAIVRLSSCNWESEWLGPVRDVYSKELSKKTPDEVEFKMFDEDATYMPPKYGYPQERLKNKDIVHGIDDETVSASLTDKLKETLQNAKVLADKLKTQIMNIASQELLLKEAIVNGRSGVTVLTVMSVGKLPRTYIIRDGFWTLCNGLVQYPVVGHSGNPFHELFSSPRCIGQEVASRPDPCVFNSIIKYETIPRRRSIVYSEDNYLCLKTNFNQTLEQYLSVPKFVVNETCRNGVVKKLSDNSEDCGLRVISEYTYYPHRGFASNLPLEYCTEGDGACKLTVAWHISNTTVENFEYIKSDKAFKNFFMNAESVNSNVL